MIRSPNLNVIIKALDKVSAKMARDYGEIENLQSNNFAALKFANACYKSVEEKIVRDLTAINPQYNIKFISGEEIINDKKSKYFYLVSPIDGLLNFSRSITSFSNFIALFEEKNGNYELTDIAVSDVAHNEVFIASKGNGAYLNNRRIRMASSKPINNIMCGLSRASLLDNKICKNKNFQFRLSGCSSLDVAYLASGKLDLLIFDKEDLEILKACEILIKESGGFIREKNGVFLAGNSKLVE